MEESGSFKKIELNNTLDKKQKGTELSSDKSMIKRRQFGFSRSKKFLAIFGVILVFVLVVGVYIGLRVQAVYKAGQKTYEQAKRAADAAKKQDVMLAYEELVKTKKETEKLKSELTSLSFVSFIPLVGGYYNDAVHGVNAGLYGSQAAISVAESLIPYADVLGLKGDKSFVAGSAQDRIQIAVRTMGKVVPNIDRIEKDLTKAKDEVDKIDPNHYPNLWKFKKIREELKQLQFITDEAVVAIEEAKPLIKVLPELLGESEEKKYLVLFQNDKELRPTGGFITFYAVFRVDQGIVRVDSASDIYDLDNSIPSHPSAPDIIRKYLPKVYTFNIRDSNLSPDFVESMKEFNKLYAKAGARKNVDGIIAIDTHVLVNIIRILGSVETGGFSFNAETDKRCDCPQVVYVLEESATRPVNYIKTNRKALIGDLLYATMQKALASSPKEYWGRLFQQGLKDIEEKHILFYLYNEDAQKGVEALGWGGRIANFEGDYLHINDANFGGQKSNMYVTQSVKIEYERQENVIKKTLTIDYKNPYPHSDCNLERGGLCLNATLRNFLRVYVPSGSVLESSKGSEVKVDTKEDLGKTFFEGFITVKPLGKSQIIFVYKLPYEIKNGEELPVFIQKQPGKGSVAHEIYVNGKKVESFDLVADKTLKIKI